jgi:hypothetical protein
MARAFVATKLYNNLNKTSNKAHKTSRDGPSIKKSHILY